MSDGDSPKIERDPQVWRVSSFEGMTCKQFPELFTHREDSTVRELCKIAAWDGDRSKLDSYKEVEKVAQFFAAPDGHLRHLLSWSISQNDIDHYHAEKLEDAIEQDPRPGSPGGRSSILEGLRFATVDHPLARWVSQQRMGKFHSWRGLPAFDALAPEVAKLLVETKQRDLTMLYPAGGRHYPYLQAAFRLIDQGHVDHVKVIVTELEGDGPRYTNDFVTLFKAGLIDRMVTRPVVEFQDGGTEQTFYLRYKGKPIEIVLALNRSGEAYFRDDYLKLADVMIIHDCADGGRQEASYKLLSEMLQARRRVAPDRKQLVIMEGKGRSVWDGTPTLGFDPIAVKGPYGHCSGEDYLGEFEACHYDAAHILRLDDPRLQVRIHGARDAQTIARALFELPPRMMMVHPGVSGIPLRPR